VCARFILDVEDGRSKATLVSSHVMRQCASREPQIVLSPASSSSIPITTREPAVAGGNAGGGLSFQCLAYEVWTPLSQIVWSG